MSAASTRRTDAGAGSLFLLAEFLDSVLDCFGSALYALLNSRIFGSMRLPFRPSGIFGLFSNFDCARRNSSRGFGKNDGEKTKSGEPKGSPLRWCDQHLIV
jgi:hypothetical protein